MEKMKFKKYLKKLNRIFIFVFVLFTCIALSNVVYADECEVCGASVSEWVWKSNSSGHGYVCPECGAGLVNHTWTYPNNSSTICRKCTVCGYTQNHNSSGPYCDNAHCPYHSTPLCSRSCNHTKWVTCQGHSMGSWQQNDSATHKKTCGISGCTYIETENHYDNDSNYACDVCGYDSRTPIAKPSAVSGLTYNGSSQTGVSGGTGYSLSGTSSATNAGSYTATASLQSGYKWSDGTTANVSISWSIAKKSASVTWSNTSLTYNGSTQKPTATATGVNSETISVSATGAINAGTHTSTASTTNGNYTLTNTTVSFVINKAPRTISISDNSFEVWANGTVQFTYTGEDVLASVTSSNTGVATVRMNDGIQEGNITVTPVWIGNTTLTVSVPTSSNYLEKTSTCVVTITDSTRPAITIGAASKVYVNSVATITIPIEINEAGTGLVNNTFTASDINIYVAGGAVSPNPKRLDFNGLTEGVPGKNSGIYRYTLTIGALIGDGELSIEIPAGSIEDKVGNTNLVTRVGRETLGSLVDNTKPVIELDGASSARYINSAATLTIPLRVVDTGAGIETSELTKEDIIVLVNNETTTYSSKTITYLSESNGVYKYRLTLNGVEGNGPLNIRMYMNKVTDKADNFSAEVTLDPTVLVDNIKPVVSVTDVAPLYAKSSILVTITVNENGSGMELSELVKSDITLRVDGQTITEANKGLTWVSTINGIYTYRLTVTNLTMTGRVEIDIPRRSSKR